MLGTAGISFFRAMRVSIYSTAFNLGTPAVASFDVKDAFSNWSVYADEISVATGDEESAIILNDTARVLGIEDKLKITPVTYARDGSDPFAYGKTENVALQACTGNLLVQQNLDERMVVDPARLEDLYNILQSRSDIAAFWVPNLDLYGARERCLLPCKAKWMIHRRGLYRGAVSFGIKSDGRPDYNLSSTDELIDSKGNLVPTVSLIQNMSLPNLRLYVGAGWPLTMHLGYLSFSDRLQRSLWWKQFWNVATGGDENQHPTSIGEMASRDSVEHGLPLWRTKV